MEALLKNVPQDLTERRLREELTPYMKGLGIKDWGCCKISRKAIGYVQFSAPDGRKFLQKHGKITGKPVPQKQRTKDTARLFILQKPVFVEESGRRLDPHLLSHLQHETEKRAKEAARPKKSQQRVFCCDVNSMACGRNAFVGDDNTLTFLQQTEYRRVALATWRRRNVEMDTFGFRINIQYQSIQEIIANKIDQTLTLILSDPPQMYEVKVEGRRETLSRTSRILPWKGHENFVAHCLVYQFSLGGAAFEGAIDFLKSCEDLAVAHYNLARTANPKAFSEDHTSSYSVYQGNVNQAGVPGSRWGVPFPVVFQVAALVSGNYIHPADGSKMLEKMRSIAKSARDRGQRSPLTTDGMKHLFQSIPYPLSSTDPSELDVGQLVKGMVSTEVDKRLEDPTRVDIYGSRIAGRHAWVLKAMVTPTRIVLSGPEAESRNRILRKFPDHHDYFLRVTFCDESGADLMWNPKISNDEIYERYKDILKTGILIAGRRFGFLGFSHSSLRSHSAWFSVPFMYDMQVQSYNTILRSLGDFGDIRVVAKRAARIGQAFSETPYAVPLFECGIKTRHIPDVKSPDGQRVFSDGVGRISQEAMEIVCQHLPMKVAIPTCYQIRYGGAKGILCLDSRLQGRVIEIRKESMVKFPSEDLFELGICDVASRPLRLVLNRQMIKILEDMGTPDEWFLDQQEKALDVLREATSTPRTTSAFLARQSIGETMGLAIFIRHLEHLGIDYGRDSFLRFVVELVVLRELRLLKHKARIPVEKGVTLFGTMDETGFLEEGEIYVAYDKRGRNGSPSIDGSLVDGKVLVTRSPALHPGDIQTAYMKTPPLGHPLRHHRNCIVFSQKGDRDLPSQLSGGDLDGDLYSVIWDPGAYPKWYFLAADYPRVVPKGLDREVTREDMAEFFTTFMQNDVLGMIATRHQILADHEDEGTLAGECLLLAELHSTAVDYSKTGIPVDVSSIPKAPMIRPDFLATAPPLKLYDVGQLDHIAEDDDDDDEEGVFGGAKYRHYKSTRILGKLYRSFDERKIWHKDVKIPATSKGPSIWSQILDLTREYDPKHRIQDAWRIRSFYEDKIEDLTYQFSEHPRKPLTEVEVFCGFVFNKRGSQTRKERDSSIKISEEVDRIMAETVTMIRDRAWKDDATETDASSGIHDDDKDRGYYTESLSLCRACVLVGCMDATKAPAPYQRDVQLLSFRVVAGCCLLREYNAMLEGKRGEIKLALGFTGRTTPRPENKNMTLPIR